MKKPPNFVGGLLQIFVNRIGLSSLRSDDPYSCEVLTQKITQAVHPLRGYTLFFIVRLAEQARHASQ
ncbi:MAG TPA: hypothetical protein VGO21_00300 [Candidatus Paceibacterota bacterium]|nr:hypothetical protein [Candidatus Paceibacterota bacterium]